MYPQGRARQLYKAGYRTLQSIAKANPRDLREQIPYLNNKVVAQIIAAAKVSYSIQYILIKVFDFMSILIH